MEPKLTFAKGWMNFWSFIASILQDKLGDTSSKRIVILGALLMFYRIGMASLKTGAKIDENVLMVIAIVLISGIGLTIPEWFSPKVKSQNTPPV